MLFQVLHFPPFEFLKGNEMPNPYKARLLDLAGAEAIVHRAGATDLRGKIADVQERGCIIAVKSENPERVQSIFVAFRDIRGVGTNDWDMDVIAH